MREANRVAAICDLIGGPKPNDLKRHARRTHHSCTIDAYALGFASPADPRAMEKAQELFFRNLRRL
jgi:hypothetical protein